MSIHHLRDTVKAMIVRDNPGFSQVDITHFNIEVTPNELEGVSDLVLKVKDEYKHLYKNADHLQFTYTVRSYQELLTYLEVTRVPFTNLEKVDRILSDNNMTFNRGKQYRYFVDGYVSPMETESALDLLSGLSNAYLRYYGEFMQPMYDPNNRQVGIMVDIARNFISGAELIRLLISCKEMGYTYFQLHFSDDNNYALESAVLGQTVDKATRDEFGNYVNPVTTKPFLSKVEYVELLNTAKRLGGIIIIPELGGPSHVGGMVNLLSNHSAYGEIYPEWVNTQHHSPQFYFHTDGGVDLYRTLMDELVEYHDDDLPYIHLGGDEFTYDTAEIVDFTNYFNRLVDHASKHGTMVRLWNDVFLKDNIVSFEPSMVEVTYWSFDGNKQDPQQKADIRAVRATPEELIDAGFNIINCNSYYTYSVPNEEWYSSFNGNFAARDAMLSWGLEKFDSNTGNNLVPAEKMDRVIGAQFSIWSENAGMLGGDTISVFTEEHRKAIQKVTTAYGKPTLTDIRNEATAGFINSEFNAYINLAAADTEMAYDLRWNGRETLWFIGADNPTVTGVEKTIWIDGSSDDAIMLPSQAVITMETVRNERINVTYTKYLIDMITLWVAEGISVVETPPPVPDELPLE